MEIDDTEKNPFDTGAENPGYDETDEKLMKWTVFLQVHPDVVQKI